MTAYLIVNDTSGIVTGIGSKSGISASGETVREVADTVTLNKELILRGATVTLTNGVVTAINYPTSVDRNAEKFIGRIQAVVNEVIEINRKIPVTNEASRDAWQATESWAIHLGGAGRLVAHNSITGINLAANAQERAVAQLETMPGLTKTWNGVMRANQANRNAWLNFAWNTGAAVYVDCLNEQGRPRRVDGAYNIILPGGFPANFDPYAIS